MADKFFSTKKTPEALAESAHGYPDPTMEQELYPYGLTLHFNSDTLEALPMPQGLTVGDTIEFTVRARVKRLAEDETTEGVDKTLQLQITEMNEPVPYTEPVSNADRIYGKKAEAAE